MRHGRYFGGEYEHFDVREEVALFVFGEKKKFLEEVIVSTAMLRWNVLSSDSETVRCGHLTCIFCFGMSDFSLPRTIYIYSLHSTVLSFFYTFPPSPLNA